VGWLSPLPVREFHPLEAPSLAWRAKVGARQIVEQYLEAGLEQALPTLLQVRKQSLLVGQQQVQATI
jgi:hypothetical protein